MGRRYRFDPSLAGQRAECEGGLPVEGGPAGWVGSRDFFRGRLTGLFYEEGDPPWRWYELAGLEMKPPGYQGDRVWCEEGFLFILEEKA